MEEVMPKFTVEFADGMAAKLDELATKKGVSKVDVLRRALTLYDYADRETSKDPNATLSITTGKTKKDIVLP
jgi:predicted transcriptional regulator